MKGIDNELKNVCDEIRIMIDKTRLELQQEIDKKLLQVYWDMYIKFMEYEKSKENV